MSSIKIKIGLLIVILSSGFRFSTFANQATNNQTDCFIFSKIKNGDYSSIINEIKKDPRLIPEIFSEKKLMITLSNLHAQCCDSESLNQNSISCSSTRNNRKSRTNYPQSTNLIDHLIDVQIRSWKSDTGYKNLDLDPDFLKRRTELKKQLNDTKGKLPGELNNEYLKNRSYQANYHLANFADDSQESFFKKMGLQKGAFENASERNLRTKYLNTCSIATYFDLKLVQNPNTSLLSTMHTKCRELIDNLIIQDLTFLKHSIIYKSNKQTTDIIKEYGIDYFSSRLTQLNSDLDKAKNQLNSAAIQIPKLVPKCN